MKLTVIKEFGAKKYFHATQDYISENNTTLLLHSKNYNTNRQVLITAMREKQTIIRALDSYHHTPLLYGIDQVAAKYPSATVIINGNMTFDLQSIGDGLELTRRCHGRLVSGSALNTNTSSDNEDDESPPPNFLGIGHPLRGDELAGPSGKYIAMPSNGDFTFAKGRVPLDPMPKEALGGLSTNYAVQNPDQFVGIAALSNEERMLFTVTCTLSTSGVTQQVATDAFSTTTASIRILCSKVKAPEKVNKKFYIYLAALLAATCMGFSCKQRGKSADQDPTIPELKPEKETRNGRKQPVSSGVIESLDELKSELEKVARGSGKSRVLDSAMIFSVKLDETGQGWGGTSTKLSLQFSELAPNGNPNAQFFEEFGLAGHDSNQKPSLEVEALVRTIKTLSSNRPDLLQELLEREAKETVQARSDIVIYAASLESVMEYSGGFRRGGYDGISSLRGSTNPVYRLLAAKLMPMLETDLSLLSEFYRPYLAEQDETLLLSAVDGLTTAGTSDALGMLQEMAATKRDISSNLAEATKRAVELVAARLAK